MRNLSPTPTSPEGVKLRAEFKDATICTARLSGWKRLDRAALVARFEGRASRASLYRWLKEIEGAPLKRTVPEMLTGARTGDRATVLSLVREIKGAGPTPEAPPSITLPVPTLDETVASIVPVQMMNLLDQCIRAGQDVINKSRSSNGDVRNSKLLLRAGESLRRSVETAAKLQAMITDQTQVERFHEIVFEEIALIDPDVARRIVARLEEVNVTWSARYEAERRAAL